MCNLPKVNKRIIICAISKLKDVVSAVDDGIANIYIVRKSMK